MRELVSDGLSATSMQRLEHLLQFRAWRFRLLYSHLIGVAYGAVEHNIRSICCHQSAVTMRFRAGLTSSKLALFSRSGTTRRTRDSEYLFCGEFFFHCLQLIRRPHT